MNGLLNSSHWPACSEQAGSWNVVSMGCCWQNLATLSTVGGILQTLSLLLSACSFTFKVKMIGMGKRNYEVISSSISPPPQQLSIRLCQSFSKYFRTAVFKSSLLQCKTGLKLIISMHSWIMHYSLILAINTNWSQRTSLGLLLNTHLPRHLTVLVLSFCAASLTCCLSMSFCRCFKLFFLNVDNSSVVHRYWLYPACSFCAHSHKYFCLLLQIHIWIWMHKWPAVSIRLFLKEYIRQGEKLNLLCH